MTVRLAFASQLNFLDPQTTEDGRPYAPLRYKEIVREAYILCKNVNISYSDVMKLSPLERSYLLEFLLDEAEQTQNKLNKLKAKNN